jgi:hypothetical protein
VAKDHELGQVHYHNQSCFSRRLVCGKVEHSHSRSCSSKLGRGGTVYTCGYQEHSHGEKCILQATTCGKKQGYRYR